MADLLSRRVCHGVSDFGKLAGSPRLELRVGVCIGQVRQEARHDIRHVLHYHFQLGVRGIEDLRLGTRLPVRSG